MTGMTDIVRDHFKISFTDPDKNGQMVATFSFVDMVALTKRVQTWCGKVLALMEAEGVLGLSIDADRALPLFLSDTAPEAAAVLLIAEARAAAPDLAASPWGDCPADLPSLVAAGVMGLDWAEPDTIFHHGEEIAEEKANRHGQVQEIVSAAMALAKPSDAAASPVAGSVWSAGRRLGAAQLAQPEWLWFAKEETDSIPVARYSFGRWPKVEGAAPYVRADLAVPAPGRSAAPTSPDADPAWQSANLVTHLRSYPAAPPDCDALSVGYAADLMQKAADAIDLRDKAVKAAWELLRACEAELETHDPSDADDSPVGGGESGPMAIQFGHMRRLRNALLAVDWS